MALAARLVETKTILQEALALLENGCYEQAAEILREAYQGSEQTGNAILADILSATRQICLACSQFRDETYRNRRAQEEAHEHEVELRRQIQALLDRQVVALSPRLDHEGRRMTEAPKSSSAGHSLEFLCLGKFRAYRNGRLLIQWDTLKGLSILKYLVAHHGTPIAKDVLIDVFWPDADPESARRSLHQAIYRLRQTLKREEPDFQPIHFENECYLLGGGIHLRFDFEEFVRNAQTGRQLEAQGRADEAAAIYQRAEELYLGDFMESDVYEDWAGPIREHYRSLYLGLADHLSEYYWRRGHHLAAIEICQKILARDNCNEQAHRRLMRCFQNQGQRGLAIRQYRLCVETLKSELEVAPAAETQSLFEKIAGYSGSLNLAPELR